MLIKRLPNEKISLKKESGWRQNFWFQIKTFKIILFLSFLNVCCLPAFLPLGQTKAKSLDIPVKGSGISFGNSYNFNGLRFNFSDQSTKKINGINFTFWKAKENRQADINGISIGMIGPEAGCLRGISFGGLGVAAEKELTGLAFGTLGVGSSGSLTGIQVGGLGVGAGGAVRGITIAGVGAGSGGNLTGLTLAGLGAGSGGSIKGVTIALIGAGANENISGITIAGIGAGAGGDVKGITIAGIGAGASGNIDGLTFALIGAGAGANINGITIGGIGAGCSGELKGLTIGGIGAGAPTVKGITIGGIVVGGREIHGLCVSLGMLKIEEEGLFKGLSIASFNRIKGIQNGLTIGIVNYTYRLKGLQIGLINYAKNNPKFLQLLPFINLNLR
jgi:hypothetical protein